jgi:hypothetical protein
MRPETFQKAALDVIALSGGRHPEIIRFDAGSLERGDGVKPKRDPRRIEAGVECRTGQDRIIRRFGGAFS